MSTYQYYEFQAIDRPLTPEEQEAVARLSSRVDPHPRRAVFTYSWSDFRGDAAEILTKYYDAMLYMASWGNVRLMFRFPKALVNPDRMRQYRVKTLEYPSDAVGVSTVGEYAVLDIQFNDEEGGGWIEGEGWLDSLISLRDDLLRGDDRLLYLAWLGGVALDPYGGVDEDAPVPPVPLGLGDLTPALKSFVGLFEVDEDLVQVAAEHSRGEKQRMTEGDLHRAIACFSPEEKDDFLLRLAQGEPHLGLAFGKRLQELAGTAGEERVPAASRRTVGQFLAEAEQRREEERRRQAEEAERKRIQELEVLAAREVEAWEKVYALISRKTGSAYDEAVGILIKLRDLAWHRGHGGAFEQQVGQIRAQYSRYRALIRRLDKAGLL